MAVLTPPQIDEIQEIIAAMLVPNAGDKKITQLDPMPAIAGADLFAMVDDTDTTTKKGTVTQIQTFLDAVRRDGTLPLTADWDAGAYKITANNVKLNDLAVSNGIVQTNASGDLSSNTDLPNGTTGTTQAPTDNTTKLATTAFVQQEIIAAAGIIAENLTAQLGAGGVTSFTLSNTPVTPQYSQLYYNGIKQIYGVNYTISGTTLMWITTPPSFALGSNDGIRSFWIDYDINYATQAELFVAYNNGTITGLTGDDTDADIVYNTIETNLGNHYNPSTGVFTAPDDGIYEFDMIAPLNNLTTSYTNATLSVYRTGAATANWAMQNLNPQGIRLASNQATLSGTTKIKMVSGDTAVFRVKIGLSTKTIDIPVGGICSGRLVTRI